MAYSSSYVCIRGSFTAIYSSYASLLITVLNRYYANHYLFECSFSFNAATSFFSSSICFFNEPAWAIADIANTKAIGANNPTYCIILSLLT